jgi:hypothetical protein
MNAIEKKLIEKKLEALKAKLTDYETNGFEDSDLETFKSEVLELQGIIDGASKPESEKTEADHLDEYRMKKYGTTDPEKIKAIEKPSDDLLDSILAPEGFNPNSAGMTRRV